MKAYYTIPLCFMLAGCAGGQLTVSDGQCKLPSVHTPPIAVAGRTQYDQNWIDDTTEGLVRGCGQPRPAARQPTMDQLPPPKKVVVATPVKKKKFWQRFTKSKDAPVPADEKPVQPLPASGPITPPITPPATLHWWQHLWKLQ